ncbi:hypothetical protein THAOC_03908 [Thalassiosira oceanica]|uniref:Leucine-rich repeat domain-containing protein n=1 Tax=Thalassiosira oceanica TaxID=159749 RepID=K0TA63_THAOC|nr:hypothetical protein THAOC_03908 [Thalassiosira oceanica]|eukprot:EJK74415.1 hypothetical protein THAOC_03908 [Thalassiosira oceanica]
MSDQVEPEVSLLYEGGGLKDEELRRSLTHVRIAAHVTEIPNGAFVDCDKLIELQLNEGLEVIGERAFEGCKSLQSVTIPSTVTELDEAAFYDCSNLVVVHLNEGLHIIREFAFEYCSGLSDRNSSTVVFGERNMDSSIKEQLKRFYLTMTGILHFYGCQLTAIKISISWAVSERMARLNRECMLSVEEKIRNLRRLELLQDGGVFACFPVIMSTPDDELQDYTLEVRDTNHETARSLYEVLQLIAFHELKESSIVIELAMWKSRIDGETGVETRADCRVPIPDPAKSLILEYGGFAGFLEPAIEGA